MGSKALESNLSYGNNEFKSSRRQLDDSCKLTLKTS